LNILYLINHAGSGGSEKYIHMMAERFAKKQSDKLHFIYNEDGPLREKMAALGASCKQVVMRRPWDFRAARAIAAYCSEQGIDIIHAQFPRENFIAILSKNFYPKPRAVYTSHLLIKNTAVWKLANSLMCPRNSAIIALCETARAALLRNKMPADKIRVIPNGVNIPSVPNESELARDKAALRAELGLSPEECALVSVMRFSEEKGPIFLLESVRVLRSMTPRPFKLIVVGDGEMFDELKKYSTDHNMTSYVIFTGYREDVGRILQISKIFINSSKTEVQSFAILEAMSYGLAIAATRCEGNKDLVNRANCGKLAEYGDTFAMASIIYRMMSDPQYLSKLAKNALDAAKKFYNIEITAKETYELYRSLLSSKEGKAGNAH
jgi:glycosyltransferase involved in cell wall biosynthesis